MTRQTDPRIYLHRLVAGWDRLAQQDKRDVYNYSGILKELLFHSDLRFGEYIQYANEEGQFATRLSRWLDNVQSDREKQSLLKLASLIDFVDRQQMASLYRDAYKRIIMPWVTSDCGPGELLSDTFESMVRSRLKQYRFYSITESLNSPEFINKNSLSGLDKFDVLSEDPDKAITRLPSASLNIKGLIILEDFVGTGKQSGGVLTRVAKSRPSWQLVFIPLIILHDGYKKLLADSETSGVKISPVWVVDEHCCLTSTAQQSDRVEFPYVRAVVKSTATRVLKVLNEHDDPPKDAFGFRGVGALVVTYHNTPNNTIPLIHHRAPTWKPLFRRVHHSKDGL
jgi:hypothetical protein